MRTQDRLATQRNVRRILRAQSNTVVGILALRGAALAADAQSIIRTKDITRHDVMRVGDYAGI
jgi:hypothetical protein